MAAFSEGANFSTSANGKTLDPRLLDILKTAAQQYGLDVQATSGVQGRSTGTKNHPGGYAVDIKLVDPSTGKALPNYHQDIKGSFPVYEKFAQTARVVQQAKYPELNNQFRWGGYFAGGVNPADLMHFDINPKMNGAMGGGSWDGGASSSFKKAWGITTANPGLGTLEGQRQVASIKQGLAGGPLPPMNIPQVGTALDVIDRVVPRPMPSSIASAYAAQPSKAPPPLPQARPNNIDNGGFNMAPPNLPFNSALPANRGASYGPNTGQWGPTVAQLGMQPFPASIQASGRAIATPQSVGIPGAASLKAPAIDAIGNGPQWGDLAGMLGSGAPVPMPGRPAALETSAAPVPMPGRPAALMAAPPAPVQAQRPSAPVAPPQQLLRLPSGKSIAPGVYDQGDHSVMVSDAGNGIAKVERVRGPMSIPGVIDPLREANAPTIAGGMIRKMLPTIAAQAAPTALAPVAANAQSAALGAIGNLDASTSQLAPVAGAKAAVGNAFNFLNDWKTKLTGNGPQTWAPWGSLPAPSIVPFRAPTLQDALTEQLMMRRTTAPSIYPPVNLNRPGRMLPASYAFPVSRPASFFAQPQVAAPRVAAPVAVAPQRTAAPSQSNGGGYFGGQQNAINDTLRTLGFNV